VAQSHSNKRALVYTPDNVQVGGGENYLISSVLLLQRMGYFVDFMVNKKHNICQSITCLLATAKTLSIPLIPELVQFSSLVPSQAGILPLKNRIEYEVFFYMGNHKAPWIVNPAKFGIFMCQFPFDLAQKLSDEELARLNTYHQVWMNSQYSLKYFTKFLMPSVGPNSLATLPVGLVMYPPVLIRPPERYAMIPESERKHILMIGRIFMDRQAKGHDVGIQVFRYLRFYKLIADDVKLIIIGAIVPDLGGPQWSEELKKMGEGLPIDFHYNASPEDIEEAMKVSSVFWDMTGIKTYEQVDPASIEHFGMSVVEAMSAGLIPVVLNTGGTVEIVDASCGFRGMEELDYMNHTSAIFKLSGEQRQELRRNAMNRAKLFSVERFTKDGSLSIKRGIAEAVFRKVTLTMLPVSDHHLFNKNSFNRGEHHVSKFAAIIIEPRLHYGLETVPKSVISHLGSEWKLFVYHSDANEAFVNSIFQGADPFRVELHKYPQTESLTDSYNRLLYSEQFWLPLTNFSRVLIFQTDSFLVRKIHSSLFDYHFVAAARCEPNQDLGRIYSFLYPNSSNNESNPVTNNPSSVYLGNGGLSLRSPQDSLECVRDLRGQLPLNPFVQPLNSTTTSFTSASGGELLDEDLFFISCFLSKSKKLPTREVAESFAVEIPCDANKNNSSFKSSGAHAVWDRMQTVSSALSAAIDFSNTLPQQPQQHYPLPQSKKNQSSFNVTSPQHSHQITPPVQQHHLSIETIINFILFYITLFFLISNLLTDN
jgi:glycosyltransferase involved in cell wall biosynthesis